MINRALIRIKVIQLLYSFLLTQDRKTPLYNVLDELERSLDKAYELYLSLFVLMSDITVIERRRINAKQLKYLPTDMEMNPNMRFVENKFIVALNSNSMLEAYLKDTPISWRNEAYITALADKIRQSESYQQYMALESTDLVADTKIWIDLMQSVILPDEDFASILEDKSLYWNDDLMVIGDFVVKTMLYFIKDINEKKDEAVFTFFDKYANKENETFAKKLFSATVRNYDTYSSIIESHLDQKRWNLSRIPFMDRVIMSTAMAEMTHFPKIPFNVTMNEYIELAKWYSTPNSGSFVNGLLHSAKDDIKQLNQKH